MSATFRWPTASERASDRAARRVIGTVRDYAEGLIDQPAYLDTSWGFQAVTGIRWWPDNPWIVCGDRSYCVHGATRLYGAPAPSREAETF